MEPVINFTPTLQDDWLDFIHPSSLEAFKPPSSSHMVNMTWPASYYVSGKREGALRSYMPNHIWLKIILSLRVFRVRVKLHDVLPRRSTSPIQSPPKKRRLLFKSAMLQEVWVRPTGELCLSGNGLSEFLHLSLPQGSTGFMRIHSDSRNGVHLCLMRGATYKVSVYPGPLVPMEVMLESRDGSQRETLQLENTVEGPSSRDGSQRETLQLENTVEGPSSKLAELVSEAQTNLRDLHKLTGFSVTSKDLWDLLLTTEFKQSFV